MQKLVKENEGFFILKLVASEIHIFEVLEQLQVLHGQGLNFATDLLQS